MTNASLRNLAREIIRIVSFGAVGLLATAVHYLVMFTGLIFVDQPVTLSIVGAICGAIVGYCLNYKTVFKSSAAHKSVLPGYLFMLIFGLGLNAGIVFVGVHSYQVPTLYVQLIATGTVFFLAQFPKCMR